MNDTVTYCFTVAGLDAFSARALTALLEQQPGVHRAQPSVDLGRVAVDTDPALVDPEMLLNIVIGTGRSATLDQS